VRADAAANGGNGAAAAADGSSYDYDFFCIGAGSGGVRASRVAAGTYGAVRSAPHLLLLLLKLDASLVQSRRLLPSASWYCCCLPL
jgi:hypothetical protein